MTDAFRQLSLFYHMGVRESFSMANNIILYCDTNSDSLQSLQVSHRRHCTSAPRTRQEDNQLRFTKVVIKGYI